MPYSHRKGPGKKKKLYYQGLHAIQRARERYGVFLCIDDLKQIANKIRTGKSKFIARKTTRITEHEIEYDGYTFLVAYDKSRNSVCSFLPRLSEDAKRYIIQSGSGYFLGYNDVNTPILTNDPLKATRFYYQRANDIARIMLSMGLAAEPIELKLAPYR